MGDHSKIEWTDATWNPIRARNLETGGVGHFCVHVSEGCRNCYAERLQPRFRNPVSYIAQDRGKVEIFLDETVLMQPLRWKKPRKIFVGSMTDIFGDWVTDAMIDHIFAVMALCPRHNFQVLTKRPERMREYIVSRIAMINADDFLSAPLADATRSVSQAFGHPVWMNAPMCHWSNREENGQPPEGCVDVPGWPLPNVWLGASVEDQKTADARILELLATPAVVRFISAEPLLGPINIEWALSGNPLDLETLGPISWVIAGGESGPNARPMNPDWALSLLDQCQAAEVPFFMKQLSQANSRAFKDFASFPPELQVRKLPA